MSNPNEQDKVDWTIPVAKDVSTDRLNLLKLARANREHGVEVDTHGDRADIYKKVVEGLPAPRKAGFWRRLFGVDHGSED
ncbi:MAG: hypothetical protein ABII80_02505 [bacterium]